MSTQGVDQGHTAFLAAMKANDPEALGNLCTTDALFMPPHEPNVASNRGVATWFAGIVKHARTSDVSVSNRTVVVSGDWAHERGSFVWKLAPVGGGNLIEERGNFLAIWRRQSDGSWKIVHNIWNSTLPRAN